MWFEKGQGKHSRMRYVRNVIVTDIQYLGDFMFCSGSYAATAAAAAVTLFLLP